jgi:hypothetical protein
MKKGQFLNQPPLTRTQITTPSKISSLTEPVHGLRKLTLLSAIPRGLTLRQHSTLHPNRVLCF